MAGSEASAASAHPPPPETPQPRQSLHTWGYGEFGALGHGLHLPEHFPKQVAGMFRDAEGSDNTQPPCVSAGGTHTLVADAAGRVFAAGRDEGDGRLGLPDAESDGLLLSFAQVRTGHSQQFV